MWLSAILMAVFASRYFFPALLRPPETQLATRHSFWALLHIGAATFWTDEFSARAITQLPEPIRR